MTAIILASPFILAALFLLGAHVRARFIAVWWERKTLDRYAHTLYGLQRKRFESNRALRARCAAELRMITTIPAFGAHRWACHHEPRCTSSDAHDDLNYAQARKH